MGGTKLTVNRIIAVAAAVASLLANEVDVQVHSDFSKDIGVMLQMRKTYHSPIFKDIQLTSDKAGNEEHGDKGEEGKERKERSKERKSSDVKEEENGGILLIELDLTGAVENRQLANLLKTKRGAAFIYTTLDAPEDYEELAKLVAVKGNITVALLFHLLRRLSLAKESLVIICDKHIYNTNNYDSGIDYFGRGKFENLTPILSLQGDDLKLKRHQDLQPQRSWPMHKDQVEGKMEIVKQIQKIFAIDEKGLPLEYKMRKTGVVITELVAEARTPDNVMETAAQLGLSMEDTLRAIVSGYLSENVLGLSQDKLKHSLTDFAKLMSKYFSENHHVVDLVLKQVQSLVYGGQVEMAKTTDVIDALLFYGKITTGMVDDWTTKEDTTNKSLTGDEQDLWKAFKKQIEIGTGDYKPQPANELSVLENHKPLTRATTGKQVTQPNKGKSGFARPTAATIAMRKAPPSQLTGINRNPTFSTQRRVAPTVVHSSTGGRSTMTAVGGATQLGDGGATEAVSVRPMSTEATPIGFPKPHPGAKSAAGSHIDFGAQEKRTNTNSFDKMNTMKQSARGGVSTGTTGGASRPGGAYTKTTNSTAKTAPASSGSTMRAAGGAKPAAGRRDDSTDVDTHDNRGAKNAK